MTKTKRTLRAILALVMALVMVGSVIPTMAYAADVADNLENTLDQSATFLEKMTTAFYNFFQRIINFFARLFGGGDVEPEPEEPENDKFEVGDEDALNEVLKDGGKIYLSQDFICKAGKPIVIPGNVEVTLYLQGNKIVNPVSGDAAIINKGELTIYGDGAIVNGANATKESHTIKNEGTLVINGGNIGTDDTAGAAVINDGGVATINGGFFASRQESFAGDSRSAYVFVNNEGTMVVNYANVEGKTHGLFAAYGDKLIVNGGMYKLDGNNGLGCDVAYAEKDGEIILVSGIVHTNNPRNGNVLCVSDKGNKFDADAVATDNITYVGTEIYLNGVKQDYKEAESWTVNGGTIYLQDVTIAAESGNALTIANDTKIIIDGDVKIIGAKNGAGIFVEENARLEITGSGSLTVIGNEGKEYDSAKHYSAGDYTDFAGTGGSGIAVADGAMLVIDGLNELTAEGYGVAGFGIGGNGAMVKIEDTTIKYVRGGFVNLDSQYYDAKYNKSEPEGGAAIGGLDIAIINSHIVKAEGGSKAAGIGAQFWQPANITIRNSEIDKVVGGSSSAGIGGSRIPETYSGQDIKIIIEDSKISAYGGYYGAGIGSGYDTHCTATDKAPMHTIYIKGNSEINATGGKYAAGIGTGYHVANLKGEIETSVKVTAQSGEKFYKDTYTKAQDVGFGVVDPDREAKNNISTFKYEGVEFGIPEVINPATSIEVPEKLEFQIGDAAKAIEVTVKPEKATITGITFESSDTAVATVDEDGNVTPVAVGTAVITVTVTSNDGSSKTAAVAVNIAEPGIKVENVEELRDAIKNPSDSVIKADGLGPITTSDIGTADGNYTKVDVKAGLSIKGLTVDFNGPNHVFVSAGETGEVVFENCVFTCPGFDGRVYFQSGVNATGVKLVFNNCTFKGPTIFADNSGGGVEFNNCSFEVNDSGYGFVQCMGGTDVFNDCQFNISGSKTMNIGSITKYAHLNLYSVQFNTVVYLNRCNSVSIHRFNLSGGSGTVKYG